MGRSVPRRFRGEGCGPDRAGIMAGLPQDYQDLSASQKRDALWASIQASTYPAGAALPAQGPGAAAILQLLWPPYLRASFLHSSDALPRGRVRLIHTFGSVCKVSLKINRASRQAFGVIHLVLSQQPCSLAA